MGFTIGNVWCIIKVRAELRISKSHSRLRGLLMLKKCKCIQLMVEWWGEVFADSAQYWVASDWYYLQLFGKQQASCMPWEGFNDPFACHQSKLHGRFSWVLKHCRFSFSLTLFIFLKYMCLVEKGSKLCSPCLIGHVVFPLRVLNRFAALGICRGEAALCLPELTIYCP